MAELNEPRREAAARLLPKARVYASLTELLARERADLDALIVATPPKYHADAVLAGLDAGLNVLCEKPLTLDASEFAAIEAKAAAKARTVYSVNNWAYSPQWASVLGTVRKGVLGTIRNADVKVLRTKPSVSALPGDWRKDPKISGGGILVDHGWHNLYLLRRLLGPELELAETILEPAGVVDEVATLALRSEGATAKLHMTWRASERANVVFVAGTRGALELRDDVMTVKVDGEERTTRFASKLSAGSAHPDWLAAMWPEFEAECAGSRRENLAEAKFCLNVIRAAYGAPLGAARG